MTSQNARQGGLEDTTNGADSARLMQKISAHLLARAEIGGPEHKICLPQGSRYIRTKGGNIFIFDSMPGERNHAIEVPEEASHVQFPDYRAHKHHIQYGHASFYYA
ncbi:hypothetical protein HYX05_04540 [Candidatus Woesearchaeota archaeon]|nr:hypothetical protein [Candidatus Woesearchaeota archaeon]